jgi:hypothetical protein
MAQNSGQLKRLCCGKKSDLTLFELGLLELVAEMRHAFAMLLSFQIIAPSSFYLFQKGKSPNLSFCKV